MPTAAERLLELQQRSQFYNPLRGPVMNAGPGMGQEDPSESTLPGQPEPPAPTPAEMQARIAGVKARPEQEPSTRRSADLARRGGEALVAQKKNEAAHAAFRQPEEAAGIDRFSRMLNLAQRGGVSGTPDFSMTDILPGEEQVTSQDTFRSLSKPEQDALRGKYDTGGHSGTMTFEDWLSENYAELPPEERASQMRTQGAAVPTQQVGRDPMLQPGDNSALARKRREAGLALPEGREASQYDPRQLEFMQRNQYAPDIPMTRFGGTYTLAPGAKVGGIGGYARAPDPALYDRDPSTPDLVQRTVEAHGEDSPSALIARAQAFGIDVAQYGDDLDMLRADVDRMQREHDRRFASNDVVKNPSGGYRYQFNQQKSERMLAERDANMTPLRKRQRADEIARRHAGLITEEELASLATLENTPDGFAQMRALDQALARRSAVQRERNVRNNWANRNMTIAMNNPRVARGLYMRSLQEAARSGDPMQVAAVHSSFGNDRAARDYISLSGQQQAAAAAMVAAEAGARGEEKPEAPKSYAEQFHSEMNSALAIADPVQRRTAIIGVLTKMGTVPPEQVEKRADEIIASAGGGPVSPQQTRTWWQWLSGGGQPPEQQQATTPTPTIPVMPQQPTKQGTPPSAPPASGRGVELERFMRGLPTFHLPQQVSPYGNRPRSVV